ncbi:hypothetical protein [Paracoccus methylarcula]|uniref:MotA/TolQ/ExbB proton channel domain-containing protein n=1 Tax=Paracoccus methylarcula TaxID=72022 RepID=A0A3R7SCH6_9RHOB|nr:hypothetical protein [Paracoccus methylarcula]RNF34005.1 hypothetical protein A7A09_013965 [Paracoccus methylarcula]
MARKQTNRPTRIYGRSGRPANDAIPLVVAFLIGTAGSICLKTINVPPLLAAGFAATVLVAYAAYTFLATPLRMDAETIGDNSYYLGFLFTLTSLAVTLYHIVGANGTDRATLIPEIISGFGVALSSTIVGVFLRVLMLQMKVDVESRERRARMELNEAARRFRTELGISLDKVKGFSTESLQQASEREAHMRQAFDKLMAEMQVELLKSAEQFGPALREAVSMQTEAALSNVTDAVAEAGAKAAERIGAAMSEMSDIAQSLSEKNITAANEVFEGVEKLSETTNRLVTGSDNAAYEVLQSFKKLKESSENLATGSEAAAGKLQSSQSRLGEYADSLARRVESDSDAMAETLDRAREIIEGGATGYVRAAARVGIDYETAGQNLSDDMKGSSEKLAQSIDHICRTIFSSAEQIEAATVKLEEALRNAVDRLVRTRS